MPPLQAGADDLDILAPDREIEIVLADKTKETVTVRELTFGEQLAYAGALASIAVGLKPLTNPANADNIGLALAALTENGEAITRLIALSIGKTPEWVKALPGEAGETLALTWWGVNRRFFIRRLVVYPAIGRTGQTAAGAESSQPSSATDTPEAN